MKKHHVIGLNKDEPETDETVFSVGITGGKSPPTESDESLDTSIQVQISKKESSEQRV